MDTQQWSRNPANEYYEMMKQFQEENKKPGPRSVVVRSTVVNQKLSCGHKIDPLHVPATKCPSCWGHYFMLNVDETTANAKLYRDGRSQKLVSKYGKKYVIMLGRFYEYVLFVGEQSKKVNDGSE